MRMDDRALMSGRGSVGTPNGFVVLADFSSVFAKLTLALLFQMEELSLLPQVSLSYGVAVTVLTSIPFALMPLLLLFVSLY